MSVPELKENPLVKRVVDVFDDDMSGEVDFKGKKIDQIKNLNNFVHFKMGSSMILITFDIFLKLVFLGVSSFCIWESVKICFEQQRLL